MSVAETAIRVHGLEKSCERLHFLRGVDLDVARGSIFALLGAYCRQASETSDGGLHTQVRFLIVLRHRGPPGACSATCGQRPHPAAAPPAAGTEQRPPSVPGQQRPPPRTLSGRAAAASAAGGPASFSRRRAARVSEPDQASRAGIRLDADICPGERRVDHQSLAQDDPHMAGRGHRAV